MTPGDFWLLAGLVLCAFFALAALVDHIAGMLPPSGRLPRRKR